MKLKRERPLVTLYGKPNFYIQSRDCMLTEAHLEEFLFGATRRFLRDAPPSATRVLVGDGDGCDPNLHPLGIAALIEEQEKIIDEWCGLTPAKGPMGAPQYPEVQKEYRLNSKGVWLAYPPSPKFKRMPPY